MNSQEEFLKDLQKNKENKNHPAYVLYQLLATAHPDAIKIVEEQFAYLMFASTKIGEALRDQLQTQEGRDAIMNAVSARSPKVEN